MKWAANEVVTSRCNLAEAIIHDAWDVLVCTLQTISGRERDRSEVKFINAFSFLLKCFPTKSDSYVKSRILLKSSKSQEIYCDNEVNYPYTIRKR